MDTANKRASAIGIASPLPRVFPIPDGSLTVNDRMQVAYSYAGIDPALSAGTITLDTGAYFVVGNPVELTRESKATMLLPIDPKASPLARSFQQKVQVLINSLMRARQFTLNDANEWTHVITSEMIEASGSLSNGQYTPQIAAVSNLATYAVFPATYSRVGEVVTVAGTITATPTATGQAYIELSLPIPSALTNTYQLAGSGNSAEATAHGVAIYGNVTTNVATLIWRAPDTNPRSISFVFSYHVN